MITFQQQETTEIRNRFRAAWATFHKYRQELTSRTDMRKHRLRLFDAVVSPTMNDASGTWTPTKEYERMIQSTQRKMLRLIIQDETNEMKMRADKAHIHTRTTIRTATSLARTIPTMKLTQQRLKKKNGLNA